MFTSRKLAHVVMALFALVLMSAAALAADPGVPYPANVGDSPASDQKAGSLLVYNYYTSAGTGSAQNARVNITNTNATSPAFVHLFFIASCSVADYKTDLTPNQTFSFLASDWDPGSTGYIIAIAENPRTGLPIAFNFLIGDVYFKSTTIGDGNLGAVAFAVLDATTLPTNEAAATATILLNGTMYNRAGGTLAADNIPSPVGGANVINIVVNGLTGDLTSSMNAAGRYFALIYDDVETPSSFSVSFSCGVAQPITETTPRTSPLIRQIIPAGRTGWLRLGANNSNAATGFMVVRNASSATVPDAFNGAHNLHHLTLNNGSITVPVFPAS